MELWIEITLTLPSESSSEVNEDSDEITRGFGLGGAGVRTFFYDGAGCSFSIAFYNPFASLFLNSIFYC